MIVTVHQKQNVQTFNYKNSSSNLDFLYQPLSLLIRKTSIPAITGMFFGTLYNIVDNIFAGLYSPEALAGLTLSFPVFFLTVLAFSVGFANGLKSAIAFTLGKNDYLKAGNLVTQGILLTVCINMLVNFSAYITLSQILDIVESDENSKNLAYEYLQIILIGGVFMSILYALIAPLGAIGDTRTVRNGEIVGAIANIILNPILMFGWFGAPALGIKGLALSTVIIWIIFILYVFCRLKRSEFFPLLCWKYTTIQTQLWWEILSQAIPNILNMIRIGLIFAIFAIVMGQFGTYVLAGYGVGFRIEGLIILPVIGLNMASMVIFAQNYGASNVARIEALYYLVLRLGITLMLFGGVFLYLNAPWLVIPFTKDPLARQYAIEYLRIDAFGLPAIAIINLSVAMLQGMQRPILSLLLLAIIQVILPGLLLPYVASISSYIEVWWTMIGLLWLAAISMLILIKIIMKHWKSQIILLNL